MKFNLIMIIAAILMILAMILTIIYDKESSRHGYGSYLPPQMLPIYKHV